MRSLVPRLRTTATSKKKNDDRERKLRTSADGPRSRSSGDARAGLNSPCRTSQLTSPHNGSAKPFSHATPSHTFISTPAHLLQLHISHHMCSAAVLVTPVSTITSLIRSGNGYYQAASKGAPMTSFRDALELLFCHVFGSSSFLAATWVIGLIFRLLP
jgi:hypothetical protein